MNSHIETLPLWAAIPIAVLLVIGSTLTLLGNIGLLRFRTFYERLHAPTLGVSWGTAAIILASMLMFSLHLGRPVIHELIVGVFVMITAPVTLMLLGRAALRRDRARGLDLNVRRITPPDSKAVDGDEPGPTDEIR